MAGPERSTTALGMDAAVYLVAELVLRVLAFALLPIYTHYLLPAEFGVLNLANVYVGLLGTITTFAIHASIVRLYFLYDDEQRRRFFGSLLAFLLVAPGTVSLGLDFAAKNGLLAQWAQGVPTTCLRLAIWTSFASGFVTIPITLYQAQQRVWRATALRLLSSVVQIVAIAIFVVQLRRGAEGALWASLLSAVANALLAIAILLPQASPRISGRQLATALKYSVPLVPHQFSHWGLVYADRLVLERFVSAADLGLYSLSYAIGSLMDLVLAPLGSALPPISLRHYEANDKSGLSRLGTHVVVAITIVSLGVALVGEDLIVLITPVAYHPGVRVLPWVVLGGAMRGLYLVLAQPLTFSLRTLAFPVASFSSLGVNIGMNIWLVPKYGYVAAAVNTFIGYAVLAMIAGALAQRAYPMSWDFRRWTIAMALALVLYFVAGPLIAGWHVALRLPVRIFVVCVLLPFALVRAGVVSSEERRQLVDTIKRRLLSRLMRAPSERPS